MICSTLRGTIGLLLLALALDACNSPGAIETRSARVSEIVNIVEARPPQQPNFSPASLGLSLKTNAQVRTGVVSKVRLDFSEGSIVRLSENTLLTVEEIAGSDGDPISRFQLTLGKIWVSVFNRTFQLDTPAGVATVRGSFAIFEVVRDNPNDPNSVKLITDCLEGECTAKNDFTLKRFGNLERVTLTREQRDAAPVPVPPERLRDFLDNNRNSSSQQIVATLTAAPQRTRTPEPSSTTTVIRNPTETPIATNTVGILRSIDVTRTVEATSTVILRATPTPTLSRNTPTPTPVFNRDVFPVITLVTTIIRPTETTEIRVTPGSTLVSPTEIRITPGSTLISPTEIRVTPILKTIEPTLISTLTLPTLTIQK
ncbi:MAG: FecR domain-containing protein [Chloroflexi bacterium]|nr:FecR domain-containing protein [Chloroflexota bacterium]